MTLPVDKKLCPVSNRGWLCHHQKLPTTSIGYTTVTDRHTYWVCQLFVRNQEIWGDSESTLCDPLARLGVGKAGWPCRSYCMLANFSRKKTRARKINPLCEAHEAVWKTLVAPSSSSISSILCGYNVSPRGLPAADRTAGVVEGCRWGFILSMSPSTHKKLADASHRKLSGGSFRWRAINERRRKLAYMSTKAELTMDNKLGRRGAEQRDCTGLPKKLWT